LLSTSAYEGFSNTFLEAFAAGTPVVARRAVDPDSIIGRNDLGLVADDAPGLSDAVIRLGAMGDDEYSRLTERCREYVVTNHSGRSKVPELIEAIRPILERSDSPSCGSST
jgi:glycosyltransferase involved in cell wall biosynthesis